MARKAARLLVSIWDDAEFTALCAVEQVIYFSVLSSRDLSWCGVNPLLPQRMSRISRDMNARKAERALEILAELAARTFVRHDDILSSPNVSKAMCRALEVVRSDHIRSAIFGELIRLHDEQPDARGWASIKGAFPDVFSQVSAKGSRNPSANPSKKG